MAMGSLQREGWGGKGAGETPSEGCWWSPQPGQGWSPVGIRLLMQNVVSRKPPVPAPRERLCLVGPRPGGQGCSLSLASSRDRGGPALTTWVTLGSHHPLLGSLVLFLWHSCPVTHWHEHGTCQGGE